MNEKCAEISADIPGKKKSMSTPKSIQGNQNKGKLARRARSFKDDFLDILAQMRSPGNNSVRSQSPNSSPARNNCSNGGETTLEDSNPFTELDNNVKQVQIALKHFRDVVSKNKLEMLPGNGTIVLDTVTNIVLLLKGCLIDEQSSSILSATSHLHQNVARLIRLCDNVMLYGSPALGQENVASLVQAVQEAVQNLVSLSREKLSQRQGEKAQVSSPSQVLREAGSCPSLPDIPLTPRERQILQQTATTPLSLSSESILQKFELLPSPPPKPPLPVRIPSEGSHIDALDLSSAQPNFSCAPPLPPKTRHRTTTAPQSHLTSTILAQSSDTISISPAHSTGCNLEEFSSSLLSISNTSSMDSILNSSSHHEEYSFDSLHHEEFESEEFSFCSFNSSSSSTHFSLTQTQSSDTSPPALPQKMRSREIRLPSMSDTSEVGSLRRSHNNTVVSDKIPPPLPLKKRHIMAYMEMFGNCSTSTNKVWAESLLVRHSVHTYSAMQAEWARSQADVAMSTTHSCLFTNNNGAELLNQWPLLERFGPHPSLNDVTPTESPPALPPKIGRVDSYAPPTPPPRTSIPLPPDNTPSSFLVESFSSSPHVVPTTIEQPIYDFGRPDPPVEPKRLLSLPVQAPVVEELTPVIEARDCEDMTDSILYEIDVTKYLVFKGSEEDGPDIRGGHPDALLVQATMANKNDFLYQEAFLTTYRTFLSPLELLKKLERRYGKFAHPVTEQRAARNAFSLLVRVVSDLTISDLGDELLQLLMELIFHLLCCGELNLARALRVKVLEKCESRRCHTTNYNALLTSLSIHTRPCSLLDFKSEQLAEQMTLLDAELFLKIEIPEVLVWAKEQNEERSPNLTRFTEHFNKMSFWARSRILEQKDAKDRERYVVKFIKVMRFLRKANNFNSYLALLSALDSAPIRRLEWHRQITEGLKEYCALIDSSSSFRAYRLALAETQPPCIPYIGLVLQDLTFVHIGNSDLLPDGNINFSKRWQQFNIVENMKRFKKCQYSFKKQERILALFNNFDDCLSEESMWQISETIKPRGANKK